MAVRKLPACSCASLPLVLLSCLKPCTAGNHWKGALNRTHTHTHNAQQHQEHVFLCLCDTCRSSCSRTLWCIGCQRFCWSGSACMQSSRRRPSSSLQSRDPCSCICSHAALTRLCGPPANSGAQGTTQQHSLLANDHGTLSVPARPRGLSTVYCALPTAGCAALGELLQQHWTVSPRGPSTDRYA